MNKKQFKRILIILSIIILSIPAMSWISDMLLGTKWGIYFFNSLLFIILIGLILFFVGAIKNENGEMIMVKGCLILVIGLIGLAFIFMYGVGGIGGRTN